jgi:putative transposase
VTELPANILDRQFDAVAPNRKWVADFTYIWTAEGWLYVAVVLDLYSRRIVGWSMSATMAAELVTDALVMAIWRRGRPRELLHHSDRGSQYTSEQCQRLMAEHGVLWADVFDYIERFYNPRRRHSTLGYVSPVAYEQQMRLA